MPAPDRDYDERTLEQFRRAPCAGSLDSSDHRVVTAEAGRYDSGALVRLQARVDQGRMEAVRFKAYGGVAVIACASLAAERLSGLAVSEAERVRGLELAEALGLPAEAREAALVVEDAVRELARQCGTG